MPLPIIGAVAAAVVPALARKGLDLLSGVLNGAADAGVEKVTDLIERSTGIRVEDIADDKLTEAQWIALKEFELKHQELLLAELEATRSHDIDRLRIARDDRDSARQMQRTAIGSRDWLTRNFIYIYATAITTLTFGFIAVAAFAPGLYVDAVDADGNPLGFLTSASQARARIIDTVVGFLLGVTLSAIIQFFFGSSAGSSEKSRTLEKILSESRAGSR
jgi:hypothetical protein